MFHKSFRNLMVAAAISLPVVSLNVEGALAGKQDFTVVNKTSHNLQELYVSSAGTDDWEEDVLGVDVLESGDSVLITFTGNASDCLYDIKGVFSDGDVVEDRQINLCKISTYTFNED